MLFLQLVGGGVFAQQQPVWVKKVGGSGLGNPFCVNPWNDNVIYGATGSNFLYISRDQGNTWETLSNLSGGYQIKSVAVSAKDTNMILVAQEAGPPDRIMKTTDRGSTWVQTFAHDFYFYGVPLAYNPVSGNDTVYTMGSNILWRSTDFGSTWDTVKVAPFGIGNQGWEFALVRPDSTNILIVADYGSGIWKSTDYGASWRNTHVATVEVPALAFTPTNPRIIYGARWAGGGGFVKSTDGGETWNYSTPLNGINMWGVSVSRTNPDYLITGTYGPSLESSGGIYISRDAGSTWERSYQGLISSLNYACLVLDTLNILVLQADGIWRLSYDRRTLAVTSPNGGETLAGDSLDTITWASTNITDLKLEYTTNNGTTWMLITPGVSASQGFYYWTLPEILSTQCRVRASDVSSSVSDQSDGMFTITSTIALTNPNGNQTYSVGSKQYINWTSFGVSHINLFYTVDNGTNWMTIAANVPSMPDSSSWIIPYTPSTLCKVKICSTSNPQLADQSDIVFTIFKITSFESELVLNDSGGTTDTLKFGEIAGATDSLDALLDETELSPKPGVDTFDVRWKIPTGQSTKIDCRDTLSTSYPSRIFVIEMQPSSAGYPFTIRWKPETLPSGYLVLRDEATEGILINVNMRAESTCVITDSSIKSMQILHYSVATLPIAMMSRWNLVSVPVGVDDKRKTTIYPTATSDAYTYQDRMYTVSTILEQGWGYWLKFTGGQIVPITGQQVLSDNFEVLAGWNMIGSISAPVSTSSVLGVGTNILSSFYGYNNGYQIADTIKPGRGYWIKVSSDGQLVVSSNGLLPKQLVTQRSKLDMGKFSTFTMEDANENKQTLCLGPRPGENFSLDHFELPPPPPQGVFDARFSTQRIVEVYSPEVQKPQEYQILTHSADYPITISWELAKDIKEEILLTDNVGGALLGSITLSRRGNIKISDRKITMILLKVQGSKQIPAEFALQQNYPNPFNPSTIIRYDLPKAAFVTLKVYNILGQEVATLISEKRSAGGYQAQFNASSLTSGVYFYKIVAGDFIQTKKMILLK